MIYASQWAWSKIHIPSQDYIKLFTSSRIAKDISGILEKSIRTEDYAFRFGGDEFLLILPAIDEDSAHKICERIEFNLQNIHGYTFPLTVSSGFALRSQSTSSVETLSLADQLMYEAKNSKNSEPCSTPVSP